MNFTPKWGSASKNTKEPPVLYICIDVHFTVLESYWPHVGRPVRAGVLQTLLQCGLSPNEWVLRGRRVMGGHFLPVFFKALFIVTTAVQKLLFSLHRYMAIQVGMLRLRYLLHRGIWGRIMSKLTNNKLLIFASVNHKAHKMDQNLAFNLQK